MVRKDSVILLREAVATDNSYIDTCVREDIPVVCVNRETGNNKKMSFKSLHDFNHQFWLQNKDWEYFLFKGDHSIILEKISEAKSSRPAKAKVSGGGDAEAPDGKLDTGFGDKFEEVESMPEAERVELINESKHRLDNLFAQKPRPAESLVTEALVETTCEAVLVNHASLMDAMELGDEEAKKQTQKLVDSTRELVKSSTQLISTDIFNDDLMNTLVAKSNGTILQHMTRVYLNGLAFLTYYNKFVSGSSVINKVRINFDKRYKPFYRMLLPHIHPDYITLETAYLGGMRIISENDLYNWAVGFLIHDIGKAAQVEYHEGEAAYNRDIVMEHVKVGYDSVTHKTNYPVDAGIITGYHHEYYGDENGYGYFRSNLDQYKKDHPQMTLNHCIAFEYSAVEEFQALSFFPAKVLEIIDVFDSVTDPNRKYRKPLSTEEALTMMREEFINKHPKIDIILFDIFQHFVREKKE